MISKKRLSALAVMMPALGWSCYGLTDIVAKSLISYGWRALDVVALTQGLTALVLAVLISFRGEWGELRALLKDARAWFLPIFMGLAVFGLYNGIGMMPLTLAYGITMCTPIATVLMGALFLRDIPSRRIILAIIIALGALAATFLRTDSAVPLIGIGFLLMDVVFQSAVGLTSRSLKDVSPFVLAFLYCGPSSVVWLGLSFATGIEIPTEHLQLSIFIILAYAMLEMTGHTALAAGAGRVPVVTYAVSQWIQIPLAVIADSSIFAGIPPVTAIVGVMIIAISGVYVSLQSEKSEKTEVQPDAA
jgi:drug/metabolite transporter (DMT)-like permease